LKRKEKESAASTGGYTSDLFCLHTVRLNFRNEKLSKLNLALREQLEESQKTNESLTNDLQKLALDWQQMRDEMLEKEEEWKEEEQVKYYCFCFLSRA
jgi:predicted nuclease with TOPRIM domain